VLRMIPIQERVGYQLACRAHRNDAAASFAALGLYVGQDLILVQLWAEEGLTQSQLTVRVGIDVSTMTKALQRLERYGPVERCKETQGMRVSRVHLTKEGRALQPAVTEVQDQVELRAFAGFSDSERASITAMLCRVADNLERVTEDPDWQRSYPTPRMPISLAPWRAATVAGPAMLATGAPAVGGS